MDEELQIERNTSIIYDFCLGMDNIVHIEMFWTFVNCTQDCKMYRYFWGVQKLI